MFRKAVIAGAEASAAPKPSLVDAAVLRLHALAVRLDRVPSEFGDVAPVDETDPRAVRAEWLRQYRIWADSNPERLFAIKVGGLLLGVPLLVLLAVIAAM
ncbi:hypothetical protein LRS10_14685 [Phenylobacterium sp. J426]|uniref:hypothetical protein n=1 Tax=Phenylobacterium sp. J426 TaxID=2898439 RepID=UPI002150FA59|nr:hypothetical protein [Phenylobacterium sp. J426]MCR5875319.1 hypothetical protein [Phenylobacterium sp. J426]